MKWIALIVLGSLCQQDSTTDAGVNRAAILVRERRLPPPDEIRVYDFINYHRHEELPEPAAGASVALDARLLRAALPKGPARAFLQVGVRTRKPSRDRDSKPVNLCLVIDRSGSMGAANKMGYLKEGLKLFVDALNEGDLLSIVVFSNTAETLRPALPVNAPEPLASLIDGIQLGGGTNLHAGLMLGYQEVAKNLHVPGKAPKVILLSDGQANQGVTGLEQIVAESKEYNDKGIALSTIGLGLDYNDRLMSQLAAAGKGTYHFLDSAEGIQRTFLQEVNSLLEKVGRDPVARVTLLPGVTLRRVYGYAFRMAGPETYDFRLLDLPLGLTQIIPLEVDVADGVERIAEVRLTYRDEAAKKEAALKAEVRAERRDGDVPADPRVLKNALIADVALAFRDACRLAAEQRYAEARDRLDDALKSAETFPSRDGDKDLARILGLTRQAREILR